MGNHLNNWIRFCLAIFGFTAIFLPLNLPACAETKLLNINLESKEDESFINLIQQAELTATKTIDQEFHRSVKITEVEVTVIGERNGQEVPLLSTKVSRLNWQAQPQIQLWTSYFTKAAILLGFNSLQQTNLDVPTSVAFSANKSNLESDPGFRDD